MTTEIQETNQDQAIGIEMIQEQEFAEAQDSVLMDLESMVEQVAAISAEEESQKEVIHEEVHTAVGAALKEAIASGAIAVVATKNKKKKKAKKPAGELSVAPENVQRLREKFTRAVPQRASLLVPVDRPAVSYLSEAIKNFQGGQDGQDHINVSLYGKTRLGQWLDINAHTPFTHPELGNFMSVGGLWLYVKAVSPDDSFRYIFGEKCRTVSRNLETRKVHGFRTIIADATWIKIISDPDGAKAMMESELPFQNYFLYGSLSMKKDTAEAIWYCDALTVMRDALRQRVSQPSYQPSFAFLEL